MSFFRTVFQVCTGTTVFLQLMNRSLWRAFFHFVLLIFLLSFSLAAVNSYFIGREIKRVCNVLFEQVGGVKISKDAGIRLLKNPDHAQSYILNPMMRLDYFPGGTFQADAVKKWDSDCGIVLLDRAIITWFRSMPDAAHEQYMVMSSVPDGDLAKKIPMMRLMESKAELGAYLADGFSLKKGEKIGNLSLWPDGYSVDNPSVVAGQMISGVAFVIFCMAFFGMSMLGVFTVFFFALAQYFWSSNAQERRMSFRTVLVITLYAAVPPLIIAALLSGIGVPFLSFQTVFFIAFFIYHLVVFSRVQKQLNPPKKDDEDIF